MNQLNRSGKIIILVCAWIIAIVVAAFLWMIPFIGWFLALLVIVFAVAFTVAAFGKSKESKELPMTIVTIPELITEEVVGESRRQEGISDFVNRHGREVAVNLYWDADNEADPGAVAVELVAGRSSTLCGYLSRTVAPKYLPTIQEQRGLGRLVYVPAQVFGGTPEQPNYGVWIGQKYGDLSQYED